MRVICPNCEQRGLIDAAALSGVPVSTLCPRCATPYRVSLHNDQAPRTVHATTATHVAATRAAGQNSPFVLSGDFEDVLALPRAESHAELREVPACVVLDFDEELQQPLRARAADDNYRVAARLLNASPLWLLVAGFVFVSLAVLCDRLLNTADGADATAVASFDNQATNRSAPSRARDESQRDESQSVGDADTEASAAQDSTGDQADDSGATKPAPVSDFVATPADSNAPAVATSVANARQDVTPDANGVGQTPTRLTLQLASYRVEDEAQKLAAKLQAQGFEARIVEEQHAKRPWYLVQTKIFDTREEAERHLAELRAKNFASSYTVREVD